MDPTRAIIEDIPMAALRTTVGNISEQYKYTTMNTMKVKNTPKQPNTMEYVPSGTKAMKIRHKLLAKLEATTKVLRFKNFMSGIETKQEHKDTLPLATTFV
ncbi:unnamed protein product, partial [Iphiclides podalirius]